MQIKILSPLWGYEQEDSETMIEKIARAGYDGIDTWLPDDKNQRERLLHSVEKFKLCLVVQQHQAEGKTFEEFKTSFLHYLELSTEGNPLFINSHTGRDYFSYDQNIALIDLAQSFSEKKGIKVLHETHRGRFAFSPFVISRYFKKRPGMKITADLSHWVCVTESFLDGFSDTLQEAITRTKHVHARIGYEESPQVPDPRAPEWQYAADHFINWWDRIVQEHLKRGSDFLTFTTEFGPPPYLQTEPYTNKPVADQFEINIYMKDLLRKRYASYCQ